MQCLSNLRQLSVAAASYSSDHQNQWPPSATGERVFSNALLAYTGLPPGRGSGDFMKSPFVCPAAKADIPNSAYAFQGIYTPTSYPDPATGRQISYGLSYAQNVYAPSANVPMRSSVVYPAQMMLYLDFQSHYVSAIGSWVEPANRKRLEARHGGEINAAFVDGSVRPLKYSEVPLITPTYQRFWVGR